MYYYTNMDEIDNEPGKPKSIMDLLGERTPPQQPAPKSRRTERGDLITYFHERITDKKGKLFPIAFIAQKLAHLKLPDLYYLKSVCDKDAGRKYIDKKTGQERTLTFGQIFWTRLRP